jgi:hypothetical protein
MRRYALLAGLAMLGATTLPAHAGTVRTRTVKASYTLPGGVAPVINGDGTIQGHTYGSAFFDTNRNEYAISLSATDDHGVAVLFDVVQGDTTLASVCGATTAPLRLPKPGARVMVYINAGQCDTGVSTPTTGTITARLAYKTR